MTLEHIEERTILSMQSHHFLTGEREKKKILHDEQLEKKKKHVRILLLDVY